ncbi:MAG: HAD-IIA family hydrolase [Cyclobacteriaceae bacterium]
MEITHFRKVVEKYKIVFFDAYGVLKNSQGLIEGIDRTFEFLNQKGIDYYILTNDASRGPKELSGYYTGRGLTSITPDKIISSGMLAREYLRLKVNTGTVAYMGTQGSNHYLRELGLHTISMSELDINNIDRVNAVVFMDDEGFDWNHDINKALNLLRKRNIPVIVANTDKSYPVDTEEVAIAVGGIANMLEDVLGKKFIKFGKPDAQMFIFAYEHTNTSVDRNEILMVGDTLFTDILGGNKFGIDTALVLTGNTFHENANDRIKVTGIIPDYICRSAVV